ncbi:TonB-dependent receptor [Crocinitomix algicola]|uniref:TonB-dependent receptor n=1 Tax=Crocinitomix algicola TaxID=1740263 RepID=UPI0008721EC7|nr:TonB-dependent receptor [Crocinitomix algicola]
MNKLILVIALLLNLPVESYTQSGELQGFVQTDEAPVPFVAVFLKGTKLGSVTDANGAYTIKNIPFGTYVLTVSAVGYEQINKNITIVNAEPKIENFSLSSLSHGLGEVVVSGTMKEISKLESPVPVEIYTDKFFKNNPSPSIFESLQQVNGVRPQINCNICNTGDIHINGLEGPYTMILIDGMPIVSGLATVYGLSGIPQSLIERVEIVKGPASTLYGSEAVGGLINIITKKPGNAPLFSADVMGTTWAEINTDIAGKFSIKDKAQSLIGVNYFNYQLPIDNNNDGFTDVTLQNRISLFNKWSFKRKKNRIFSLAGRYVYEDRWGGDMNWNANFRGGDSIYGESIYTSRWELFGTYQLPVQENISLQFSANGHNQNSVYGDMSYIAEQYIGFGQLIWDKSIKRHDILLGATIRYTYYDDNTPATASFDTIGLGTNMASVMYLPGLFLQDEIALNDNNKLLLGLRFDQNSIHGNIITPRLNYKWNTPNKKNTLRFSIGNGYRVANIFTEDHAALTGSRQVEFLSNLAPETSWNSNINFVKKIISKNGSFLSLDASAFYTYFDNKIIADYDSDPNKISYDNLTGYAVSKGVSLNLDFSFNFGLKMQVGGTLMDVYSIENEIKTQQLFTEKFNGVWNVGYTFPKSGVTIDYTGNVYSPMRLPLLSDLDPRSEYSPWWSIQNIQISKQFKKGFELYGGIKNLLNWTPNKGIPFLIARPNDPFDKTVDFDEHGQAIANENNPYGLTFDPAYVYGPNQGIRGFIGFRYHLK